MKNISSLVINTLLVSLTGGVMMAQSSLSLSSGTTGTGGSASLDLSLNSPNGKEPSATQWTFSYPASSVSNFAVSASPALTAAGMSLSCAGPSTGYICVASGMNSGVITNGVVAKVSITLTNGANSTAVGVIDGYGASAQAAEFVITTASGGVSVAPAAAMSGLSCAPATIGPGAVAVCTVTMTGPLPSGGSVALSSTGSITAPASVLIAPNASTASFNVTAGQFTADQTANLTANLNGTAGTSLSLVASIQVSSLTCASYSLAASASTTCTVTVSKAAPAGGLSVIVVSSLSSALSVPASVQVPASATSATFTAAAGPVTSSMTPMLTAGLNGSATSVSVTVTPATTVSSLACAATTLTGPATTNCTVTISAPAPVGGAAVTVASSVPAALTAPASVLVPAGASTATFTATAAAVDSAPVLTASLGASAKSVTFAVSAPMSVTGLSCSSTSLPANTSTACTVTISKAAPTGGTTINLSSSASAISVPASVVAAAGATTATFTAAGPVTSTQNVTLTAAIGASSQSLAMSVTPAAALSSLRCADSTLTSNTSTSCTVTLTGAAASSGVTVAISSSNSILTAPASLLIPSGAASANFTVTTTTIHSVQTATLRAAVGSTATSATILLAPGAAALSQVTCSPATVTPGAGGTCTVTMTGAVAMPNVVTLKSSNVNLTVPPTVTIARNTTSSVFSFTSTRSFANWAVISAANSGITKSAVIQVSGGAGGGSSSGAALSCDERYLPAGGAVICEIRYEAGSDDPGAFTISSSSDSVRVPAQIQTRPGSGRIRFEARVDEQARQENVVLEASFLGGSARESLTVVSSGAPLLRLPGTQSVSRGAKVAFAVSATDMQNLPLTVVAKNLPRGASFDSVKGEFAWTPGASDTGENGITFEATDAAGMASTGSVSVRVLGAKPVIAGLRNGAGANALGACAPGALVTLLGALLSDDQLNGVSVQVRVNGEPAAMEAMRAGEIDFVCPRLDAGTPLSMTVEVDGQVSEAWQTTMEETAPGLFSVNGAGTGQGLAMHARGMAALPRFEMDGSPAVAGESIRLFATGIDCAANPANERMLVTIGGSLQPVSSISPSAFAGICEVSVVAPASVSGSRVELVVEAVRANGSRIRSNAVQVAIE